MWQYPRGFQQTAAEPCDYEENEDAGGEKKKTKIMLITAWHITNLP
jgi:hypothetical protein